MGDADGLLCGWCWRGWGRGSWDAAPLSGSRGLSLGWAHQSSLSKVSSGTSEIMHLGIGKGDITQERLQDTTQTNREAGGAGRDREFTVYLSLQKPHSTEGWQTTRAAKSCFHGLSSPPSPWFCAGRCQRCKAEPYRGRLRQLEGVCPAGCRGSASFHWWYFWQWLSAWIKIFLSWSRADCALELNQAIFGYQKRGCEAGRLSHWLLPVACSEAGSVEDVGRGEAGTSADPAFKRNRPSCSTGMDVPAPADWRGRMESWVILDLERMLSKPQRNPRKGEEVKAGISSQVFVVFAQTFTLQGLLMEKEEVRECTCAKAHLQSLFPSLFVLWSLKGFIFSVPSRSATRKTWREAVLALGTEAIGLHGFSHPKASARPGIRPIRVCTETRKCLGLVCRSTFKNIRH